MKLKKIIYLTILAMCLGVGSSCSNKNDKVIDQFETIVKKMKKTKSFVKQQALAQQAQDVLKVLDNSKLTTEQMDRVSDLKVEYASVYTASSTDALKGLFGTMSNVARSFSKATEDSLENVDDSEGVADAFEALTTGLGAVLGTDESDESN